MTDSVKMNKIEKLLQRQTEAFDRYTETKDKKHLNTPIIMTQFQGMGNGGTAYNNYSTAISELAASIPNTYAVDVSGAGLRDVNHWNYSGMKQVAGSLLDVAEGLF